MEDGGVFTAGGLASLGFEWYAVAAVTTLFWVAATVYFWYPTWLVRHVPAPPYLWGLGHLPQFAKHGGQVFNMFAKKYGKVYRFQLGRLPVVVIADPELCRQIGEQQFKLAPNRTKPPFVEGSKILGHMMAFTREDESWLAIRGVVMPLFHTESLSSFLPMMERVSTTFNARVRKMAEAEEDININNDMRRVTMDAIGEAAFGVRFGMVEAVEGEEDYFVKVLHKSIDSIALDTRQPLSFIVGAMFPILQRPFHKLMLALPWSMERYIHDVDGLLLKELNEITEKRKRDKTVVHKKDALSLLLNTKRLNKENKQLISKSKISALTYEFLFAGSDTTSVTLGNAIYFLSQHPEAEKKLLDEIDANFDRSTPITLDDFPKFMYVDWVIKETMRLKTGTPITPRELIAPMNLGGYHLPKGSHVWLAMGAIHDDPKYFPNPEQFRPERWDPNCEESKKRHPTCYMPFGLGPRICIGKKFALQEALLVLIHLYSEFTFSLSPGRDQIPVEEIFTLLSRPKYGIFVRAHKRF